ncbi:MAG: hypothetical protein AB7O24_12020 [Kofleriaceae bacterium]
MRLAACTIAAMVLFALRPAHADDPPASYRAVIDRVELEPSLLGGTQLRVELSALALQGGLLDLTEPGAIKAVVGTSELRAPYLLGRYGATRSATAIVFVVQATLDYSDALPAIIDALDQSMLAHLDERAQVAIIGYGEAPGTGKLGTVKAARTQLAELQHDGTAGDPALLDTLDRAVVLLRKLKPVVGNPVRKLIVVVGDGRDRAADRDRVTRLGERAAKDGIRIHALAYSANDVRRPLLLLGELSKRSLGTFRWVLRGTSESWVPAFQQLHDELANQYVVTWFLDQDTELAGKKLKIVTTGRTEVTSNEAKIPAAACFGQPCEAGYCAAERCVAISVSSGRGVLGWIALIGGIFAGVVIALGLIGYVITKRQQLGR